MPELFSSYSRLKSLGSMWCRLEHLRAISHHLRPLRSEIYILLDRLLSLRAEDDPNVQEDIRSTSLFRALYGSFNNAISNEQYSGLLDGMSYQNQGVRLFARANDRNL